VSAAVFSSGGRPGPPALPAVAEAAGVAYSCGPVDQIPYGEGRAFAAGDHQVAVFRKRDGSLRAVSAVCPHKGGPIADGQIDNKVVLCPLHLNAFELDTGCSTTGAAPLRIYPVQLEDGEIVVFVS
jgi:nitrite reductase/ring-hydroxylating ferredoxin subunit